MGYGFKILVEGEYALFTRPEFKVERVSYDVPTVSAMEGLIKSIYWKRSGSSSTRSWCSIRSGLSTSGGMRCPRRYRWHL